MGIHELELIDLEEEEERAYQRQNRRASRPARRKELEEWPRSGLWSGWECQQ